MRTTKLPAWEEGYYSFHWRTRWERCRHAWGSKAHAEYHAGRRAAILELIDEEVRMLYRPLYPTDRMQP